MEDNRRLEDARDALVALYAAHRPHLGRYAWEWESDRWAELLVVLLAEGAEVDYPVGRRAVHVLSELDLLSSALLSDPGDRSQLLLGIFYQLGLDEEKARKAIRVLSGVSTGAERDWGGHIQRILRAHAPPIIGDMSRTLSGCGLSPDVTARIVTRWLQNVASFPVLIKDDAHIAEFCKQHRINESELVDIADAAGVNLATFDDVLAAEYQPANSEIAQSPA